MKRDFELGIPEDTVAIRKLIREAFPKHKFPHTMPTYDMVKFALDQLHRTVNEAQGFDPFDPNWAPQEEEDS